MIWLVTNAKGQSSRVIAADRKAARANSRVTNPHGKRSNLDVRPVSCEAPGHYDRWGNGAAKPLRQAVAYVRDVPMCPVCIAHLSKPLDERVAELEARVASLEDQA